MCEEITPSPLKEDNTEAEVIFLSRNNRDVDMSIRRESSSELQLVMPVVATLSQASAIRGFNIACRFPPTCQ